MARRLKWTILAKMQRKEILDYWNKRNKSKNYSRKLNKLFNKYALLILEFPEVGIELKDSSCRKRLIKDFYFIYKISVNQIEIITIWDTRQNPEKLEILLGL